MKFEPLNAERAAGHAFRPPADLGFAAPECLLPLQVSELAHAVAWFPIAVVRQSATRWCVAALTGTRELGSVFLDASRRWVAPYAPRALRHYPFALADVGHGNDASQRRKVLCVDRDSDCYLEAPEGVEHAVRFFAEDGRTLSDAVRKRFDDLLARDREMAAASAAIAALAEAGALAEWRGLRADDGAGEIALPEGIYRVDEAALMAVDAATQQRLTQRRAWGLAYAQLLSMPRVAAFARLVERRGGGRAGPQRQPPDLRVVEDLFGQDDDTLSF